jgi:thiol:disulfide interchange protein
LLLFACEAFSFLQVDCTDEKAGNQGLCQQHGVKGYPTIQYFVEGNKKGSAYQGGRDYKSFYGHVRKMATARKKVIFLIQTHDSHW